MELIYGTMDSNNNSIQLMDRIDECERNNNYLEEFKGLIFWSGRVADETQLSFKLLVEPM